MDIYRLLMLFITFLKIGAFVFGGGYAMVPVIKYEVVDKHKWLTEEEFLELVAIAESTPGPLAINSATYVGYRIGGVLGSVLATLAVVLPPFAIILLIAMLFPQYRTNPIVNAFLRGILAAVLGLIASSLIIIIRGTFRDLNTVQTIVTAVIAITSFTLITQAKQDPIVVLFSSGVIGIVLKLLGIF